LNVVIGLKDKVVAARAKAKEGSDDTRPIEPAGEGLRLVDDDAEVDVFGSAYSSEGNNF